MFEFGSGFFTVAGVIGVLVVLVAAAWMVRGMRGKRGGAASGRAAERRRLSGRS